MIKTIWPQFTTEKYVTQLRSINDFKILGKLEKKNTKSPLSGKGPLKKIRQHIS